MTASTHRTGRPRSADFTTPLTIPGGAVAGAEIVRELAPEVALPAWQTLRSVLMWAGEEPAHRGDLFEPCAMADWERELLEGEWDPDLRVPLAVLVGELSRPVQAAPDTIAHSCLCVANWALDNGGVATALAFAEAAALAWPQNPRYSWMAGRLLRTHGRLREAEQWLKRAERAAASCKDYEGQIFALQSLGNLHHAQGNYQTAGKRHLDALRLARRHRVASREGEILHDLLVISNAQGELSQAEEYGRAALECYRAGHQRLPSLAHDVACIWMNRGYCTRALLVLRALPPFFSEENERIMVFGSAARAAGACGEHDLFAAFCNEIWALGNRSSTGQGVASALFEMAHGALDLGEWDVATRALRHSADIAQVRGEQDVVAQAEQLLQGLHTRQRTERRERFGATGDDGVAVAFLRTLEASMTAGAA